MDPHRPGGEPGHHRPLRHPRLWPVARRCQAGRAAQPDRPVRRGLLLRLHGGRARGSHVARRRFGGGVGVGVRGPRQLQPDRGGERAEAGTTIVLHVKPDADEFLEPYRLETIIRKWADHITVPITVARDGKDEPANEGTALWRKSKSDVTEKQYTEFYRHLGHIFDKPWATLHWRAEGAMEYSALLFVPGSKPFEAVEGQRDSRVRLHVRRMFITDEANLLPPWLRSRHRGGGHGGPAAERVARDAAIHPRAGPHPQGRHRPRAVRTEDPRQGRNGGGPRGLRRFLAELRPGAQGRPLGGCGAPRRPGPADALQVVVAGRLDLATRLRRAHEGRAGGHLHASGRRDRRTGPLAPAGGIPRPRRGGTAAGRPGGRVLARADGELRRQADPFRDPGRPPTCPSWPASSPARSPRT